MFDTPMMTDEEMKVASLKGELSYLESVIEAVQDLGCSEDTQADVEEKATARGEAIRKELTEMGY